MGKDDTIVIKVDGVVGGVPKIDEEHLETVDELPVTSVTIAGSTKPDIRRMVHASIGVHWPENQDVEEYFHKLDMMGKMADTKTIQKLLAVLFKAIEQL